MGATWLLGGERQSTAVAAAMVSAHKRTCVLVHLSTRHTTHAYHVRFHTLYVSVQKASSRPAAAAVVAEYAGFSRGVKFYSQQHTHKHTDRYTDTHAHTHTRTDTHT